MYSGKRLDRLVLREAGLGYGSHLVSDSGSGVSYYIV